MNGLRVYINALGSETKSSHRIFYSRRDDGPYYRWDYVAEKNRWCCSRVRPDLLPYSLRTAQKAVPTELRTELLSHYLD
ncbi:MAG: hypothetical protein QOJ64_758 [Acidobacteriota bacterium]|jgi:hypothetical protein|nr:hypothetical protein [Acidobacteriota bacterium]